MEIGLQHIQSFRQYHLDLFDEFLTFKDYSKLDEYVLLFDTLKELRNYTQKDPRCYIYLETYIGDLKETAERFYDIAEKYNYDEYSIVDDYTDQAYLL